MYILQYWGIITEEWYDSFDHPHKFQTIEEGTKYILEKTNKTITYRVVEIGNQEPVTNPVMYRVQCSYGDEDSWVHSNGVDSVYTSVEGAEKAIQNLGNKDWKYRVVDLEFNVVKEVIKEIQKPLYKPFTPEPNITNSSIPQLYRIEVRANYGDNEWFPCFVYQGYYTKEQFWAKELPEDLYRIVPAFNGVTEVLEVTPRVPQCLPTYSGRKFR